MKKNVMMRIASVLMIAVLLTTCVISGTFAKYTAQATASAEVTVAKWAVEFQANDQTFTNTTTFDFFATMNDSNVNGKKLAPGTTGSFNFTITNDSDVKAKCNIALDLSQLTNAGLPLTFVYKDGETVIPNLTEFELGFSASKTITVEWTWDFVRYEGEATLDDADSNFGKTLFEEIYIVTATLTAEQVD